MIYLSEDQSLQYDNAAKLLTLVRGLFNREPDAGTFEALLSTLDTIGLSHAQKAVFVRHSRLYRAYSTRPGPTAEDDLS